MKTRILLSAVIAFVLCGYVLIGNPGNNLEAKSHSETSLGKIPIVLTGPGENSTNASVRLRSKQTGMDYYGYYDAPTLYFVDAPTNEEYTVYVCTNYPSHGSVYLDASQGGVYVTLSTGMCPYGD